MNDASDARPRLEVRSGADEAAAAAADHVASTLLGAIDERGQASVAFSGGSTPRRMLEELAKTDLPWDAIHVFQVDERLAKEGSDERNLTLLHDHLLVHVHLPAANLHPMPVGLANLHDAADRYERVLQSVAGAPPALDVVHLGLGADGHTASLFPGEDALEVTDADVTATAEHGGRRRLTLTVPALRRARHMLFLVTGASKREVLGRLLTLDDGIPAGRVAHSGAIVFADEAVSGPVPG